MTESLEDHKIISEKEWIKARKSLLKKEKEFTVIRDQLNQQRRELLGRLLIKSISLRDRMVKKL
jgi:predicted dithiol-disulfide oxidoreductase (DUF899 family)